MYSPQLLGCLNEPYGSWGKFQMEVIITILLEWGLWSEQGTCVQLFSRLKMHLTNGAIWFPHNLTLGRSRDNAAQCASADVAVLMSYVFLLLLE